MAWARDVQSAFTEGSSADARTSRDADFICLLIPTMIRTFTLSAAFFLALGLLAAFAAQMPLV